MKLLNEVARMNGNFIGSVRALLNSPQLVNLSERHTANQSKRSVDLGFNPFALVSETYYRENFHSDILKAVLDPEGAHKQGAQFLNVFLAFLSKKHGVDLDPKNYATALVEREPGRIDLLIHDPTSRRALILENKVNGAPDMERQLVRYLKKVETGWGYRCDAIIYLTLDALRHPDMKTWTTEERMRVGALLKPIAAFEDSESDLYHGWLLPCIETCDDPKVVQVIAHYSQLLLKLGRNAMNKPLLEEFYQVMQNPELNRAALSLQSLLSELSRYRANRIADRFSHPFSKPWIHGNAAVFEGIESNKGWNRNSYLKIHVDCESPEKTVVSFWDNADHLESILPKRILKELGIQEWFPESFKGWPTRSFSFPAQESELEEFLKRFLSILDGYEGPVALAEPVIG